MSGSAINESAKDAGIAAVVSSTGVILGAVAAGGEAVGEFVGIFFGGAQSAAMQRGIS